MADLYLARDSVLGRKVVIKVLHPRFSGRSDFVEHFLREAKIQANLENPHIVQVLSLFTYREMPCLVMQYIEGTDLEKVITKARQLKEKQEEIFIFEVINKFYVIETFYPFTNFFK